MSTVIKKDKINGVYYYILGVKLTLHNIEIFSLWKFVDEKVLRNSCSGHCLLKII